MPPISRRELFGAAAAWGLFLWIRPSRLLAAADQLIERKVPSSGESLPVIGIGTAGGSYDAVTTEAERAPVRETLRRFQELGGKVIDTAPSYRTAEVLVGELVDELKIRPSVFLATKVEGLAGQAGIEEVEQSFKRLRTAKIDLIAVHNLRDTTGQLATLRRYKQDGRIRYVGITTSFPRQYPEFEQTMKAESLDFIQVDYALDNRTAAQRILPLAADRGMAVMINLPFGRRRL
ncbi:MAG TPA: aldo/keto reductase, partial [Candidatus Sulfotelmatobacter sp.]|nr:aldo/keto reductase [Candidatus Sulfotelmatobacter sp.]